MKVLSLNCWGLPWTQDYKERMECIRMTLLQSDYDVIVLQEVFMSNDIDNYKESLCTTYPFIHYFYAGFVGSGVMFLSKYRIHDPITIPYNQSGMIYHTEGDWFSRKSICYAKIHYQDKIIHIFGTHTHAKYIENDYIAVRALQLYYFARMIKLYTKPNDAIIMAGDLNSEAHEIGVKQLIDRCYLEDPYYRFYDDSSPIYTCNDRLNKYSSHRDMPYRIDHILHSKHFEPVSYKILFKKVPSKEIFYSDHSGVEVELKYTKSDTTAESIPTQNCMLENLLSMKRIFNREYNESAYSLTNNIVIGVLVFFAYRLIARVWENIVPNSTILNSINPIFHTTLLLVWIFSNLVTFISIRCQQRTYMGAIEEINYEISDFSQ